MTVPLITISVSGPRGMGSTITGMRITALLRSLGFEAEYRGLTEWHTAAIEAQLRDNPAVFDQATEPRRFLILDTADQLAGEDD